MNVSEIPSRQAVLLDANILLYAHQGVSRQCVDFLERCAQGEVTGILPVHILAEVMHGLMLAEARDSGWVQGPQAARQLGQRRERCRALNRYQEAIRDLLAVGLKLESIGREDFLTAMALQRQYGLLTNDGLLLAVGERLRVTNLVSADEGFTDVEGFTVYRPDDLKG